MKCSMCHDTISAGQKTFGNRGFLNFCSRWCSDGYHTGLKVCVQCREVIGKDQWSFGDWKGDLPLCSFSCFNAYQEKEKEMSAEYRGHGITVKMFITPPDGSTRTIPLSLGNQHLDIAKRNINDRLATKCRQCGVVIEPGALYIERASTGLKYCTLVCCDADSPHTHLAIKRLE